MSSSTRKLLSARRQRTRELVLDTLAQHTSLTRSELSRLTGLSRSAVGDCVSSLNAEGVVSVFGRGSPGVAQGRPATLVRLRAPEGVVVGIDFGHAHISVAVASSDGELLAEHRKAIDVDHLPNQALDAAARLFDQALTDSGRSPADVRGVAAGIPAPLDVRTIVVQSPTILSAWVGLDPAAELANRLGQPVRVANDADLGAIGERSYGAARGIDDFIYVKVSHGVGAALVLGGRVYRGVAGMAGEIGHTQLSGATNWCRCGNRGCLETVVSITEVRRQIGHVLTIGTASHPTELSPLDELAVDPSAARVITEAGRTIGRVIADLVNCLNPGAIVLGGELSTAGDVLVAGVRESIDRYAQPASARATTVLAAELGARSELYGAFVIASQAAVRPAN